MRDKVAQTFLSVAGKIIGDIFWGNALIAKDNVGGGSVESPCDFAENLEACVPSACFDMAHVLCRHVDMFRKFFLRYALCCTFFFDALADAFEVWIGGVHLLSP